MAAKKATKRTKTVTKSTESDDAKSVDTSQDDDLTRDELYEKAQELDIEGRSDMDKDELSEAVEKARDEANPRASDDALAAAKKAGPEAEDKRADSETRLKESRTRSLDNVDPARGWDAQQGRLPRGTNQDLYAEDPPVYTEDQLPDPKVLKEAGYKPVLPDTYIAGGEGYGSPEEVHDPGSDNIDDKVED